MFKLDENLLIELGLGSLPAEEKNRMLAHIYETLEMRVGMKLAEQMSNDQLDEFEGFIDRNDEAGALKWLETNFPNYKQVVADELETLKSEVKASAAQIVAASQSAAAQAPPIPQQTPAQAYAPPAGTFPQSPQPQAPAQDFGTATQFPTPPAMPQQPNQSPADDDQQQPPMAA